MTLRLLCLALLCAAPALAATPDLAARTELRVCADPNNLPFSNDKQEGFENKIAAIIADDLKLSVHYEWFPQVTGFVRNTLGAHRCDLILGTVTGDDLVQTTTPYYYTSYVMISQAGRNPPLTGIDDPALKALSVGVVAGTPPANLLIKHGLAEHMRSYALVVDTRYDSQTHQMIQDVADGKLDVGLIWGPIAGYYAQHDHLPLLITPLANEPGAPRMDYHIAMGIRGDEPEWRRTINAVLGRRHDAIVAVLHGYGVPLLDEQGQRTE
jgi:quinoprotein dehydrogenase-associated probable ABC transporter substrate-binding protein